MLRETLKPLLVLVSILLGASLVFGQPDPVPVFLQQAFATGDDSSSTILQSFMQPTKPGNLIVAAVSWGDNASLQCSDSLGNTYQVVTTQYDSLNNQSLAICYASNIRGGGVTVTANFGDAPQYRRLIIHEYAGLAPGSPVDVVKSNLALSTTLAGGVTSGAATTKAPGDLIFGATIMDDAGTTTVTAGSGFTRRQFIDGGFATEDRILASPGSVQARFTFTTANRYLAQMVAFKRAMSLTQATALAQATWGAAARLAPVSDTSGVVLDCVGIQGIYPATLDPFGLLPSPNPGGPVVQGPAGWPEIIWRGCGRTWNDAFTAAGVPIP